MTAFAALAEGAWTFGHEFRGHPEVKFVGAGKQKFELGCGRAVGLWIAQDCPG